MEVNFFGIVNTGEIGSFGQDHRGRDDGAGQGPPAGLINAGDQPAARIAG